MRLAYKIKRAWTLLDRRTLAVKKGICPFCGTSLIIKLADNSISVRCVRCHASALHMSIGQVLKKLVPDIADKYVYEMSSRGPYFEFLKSRCRYLTVSEYFDDVLPGSFKGGVQCQDVHRLTYPDQCFDICTSTEVFEHVADDLKGFAEMRRILRPGGLFVFTVPLSDVATTVQRAELIDGKPRHLLQPEYHGDVIRGERKVLVFRDYGSDIVDRLRHAGFSSARLMKVDDSEWWGLGRPVVIAER